MAIEIQKNVESLVAFNKLYAVSITGLEMSPTEFHNHEKSSTYKEYITDLVILANDISIIVEVKPNHVSCAHQLAQQSYKAIESVNQDINFNDVIPIDLNWKKLMATVVHVLNFNRASGSNSRFLKDFIQFIREHNHTWLPVTQFSSLRNSMEKENAYEQRLKAALSSIADEHPILDYNDRIGLKLDLGWAQEIVLNLDKYNKTDAALYFGFWPGNTKGQGSRMFNEIGNKDWQPPSEITLKGKEFKINWGYEIKFCHFNGYVSNLIIDDSKVKPGKQILSRKTHDKFTGKYERQYWNNLEAFLDDYLINDFDWRSEMEWDKYFVNTGRNYLTLSIGYQIETIVPISYLQQIDTSQDDLTNLTELIIEVKENYKNFFND